MKKLYLLARHLVELRVAEGVLDAQAVHLLIAAVATLARQGEREVLRLEELRYRGHGLGGARIGLRVGTEGDFGTELLGRLAGFCQINVHGAAKLGVAGFAVGVLPAEVIHAFAGAGGADGDIEAGNVGIAEFHPGFAGRADEGMTR